MSDHPALDHEAARLLLPWFAAGTLDAVERAQVAAHLAECPDCQAELALDRELAGASPQVMPSPDAGWAALSARLGDAPVEHTSMPAPPPRRRDRRPWLRSGGGGAARWRWLAAAQFGAIAVLGTWLLVPATSPLPARSSYRALGTTDEMTGNVLAMFRPDTSEAELRGLLTASDARVVDGPTSAGAYVLAVPGGAHGVGLARLRRSSAVTMAEPIGDAAP